MVFRMTIHEIEESMDICDNKAFEQSEEKFARLKELLKVSFNVFEITLLPGYADNCKDEYELFTCYQGYKSEVNGTTLSFYIVNDTRGEGEITKIPSTSYTSKT